MIRNESADPVTAALDSGLRRMSEEVPEMPESFRRGWRQAVRAEAAAGNRGAEMPEASAHAPVSPSGKRSAFRSAPLQRRILSVAAILLFVLGSVLVTGDLALLTRIRPSESAISVNAVLSGAGSREQAPPVSEAADSAADESDMVIFEAEESEAAVSETAASEAKEAEAAVFAADDSDAAVPEAEESPAADAPAQTSAVSAFSEKKAALSLAQTAAPAGSAFEAAYESEPQEAEESAKARGAKASYNAAFEAAYESKPSEAEESEETRGEEASSDAAAAAGTVFGAALPTQPDAPDAPEAEAPAAVIPEAPAAAVPEAEASPAAVPAAGEASLPRQADPAGVSGPRPLRTAGFCLLGAGVLLAVLLFVFRKKG